MKLDIRNESPEKATSIVFSDDGEVERHYSQIRISKDGYHTYVDYFEIDDLIKALDKAKELWFDNF